MSITDQLAAALRAVLPYAENVADDAFNVDTAAGMDDVSIAVQALAAYGTQAEAQARIEAIRAALNAMETMLLHNRPMGAADIRARKALLADADDALDWLEGA